LLLFFSSGSVQKFLTVEKVNAIQLILEYFGNTTNSANANATRFTQIFSLDFDNGVIASASIKVVEITHLQYVNQKCLVN
jgi:myosin XVIII